MQVRHSSPGQPRRLHLRATACHQPQRMPPLQEVILEVIMKWLGPDHKHTHAPAHIQVLRIPKRTRQRQHLSSGSSQCRKSCRPSIRRHRWTPRDPLCSMVAPSREVPSNPSLPILNIRWRISKSRRILLPCLRCVARSHAMHALAYRDLVLRRFSLRRHNLQANPGSTSSLNTSQHRRPSRRRSTASQPQLRPQLRCSNPWQGLQRRPPHPAPRRGRKSNRHRQLHRRCNSSRRLQPRTQRPRNPRQPRSSSSSLCNQRRCNSSSRRRPRNQRLSNSHQCTRPQADVKNRQQTRRPVGPSTHSHEAARGGDGLEDLNRRSFCLPR